MYAKFEIRRLDLSAARKILGTAIGMCPKEALFKGYIDFEVEVGSPFSLLMAHLDSSSKLREFDRVRQLYEKYLEV